jgi:hypothetical protein
MGTIRSNPGRKTSVLPRPNQAVEYVALSRAWVLDRLMRHAQVCLGEIPLRLKMRKAHSTDATELETHLPNANAANRALDLLGREVNSPATLTTWAMKS